MKVEDQPKLHFTGVDIVNLNFHTEKPLEQNVKLDLDVQPKVFYPEEDNTVFKIIIELKLGAEKYFSLNLVAIGTFKYDKELDGDLKKQIVNVNAPAIVFPYIRSFISTLTSNLGNVTGSIILPTQFFDGELEELLTDL